MTMILDGFTYTDDGWVVAPDGTRLRAIAGGGGGTKSTTTVNVPPKSAEETALLKEQLEVTKTQNEFFRLQLEEIKKQNEIFSEQLPAQKALFEAQTSALSNLARLQEEQFSVASRLLEQEFTETPTQKQIREAGEARTLAFLEGRTPPLTAGQTQRLDTLFGTQREEGQDEIRRFAEEIAGQRGLKLSDTPIGGEAVRAGERLERGLRGARAAAELDITQAETLFSESTRQFQEGLRQQAFMNRLALVGATPQGSGLLVGRGSLPISSTGGLLGPADNTGLLGVLSGERVASAKRTTTSSYNPGFFDYFSTVLSAAGGAAGAFAASSATLKKDILPLDEREFAEASVRTGLPLEMVRDGDEYDRALGKVRETPITRWKYRWESDDRLPHIGPILELAPEEIREDRLRLNLLDYTGLLHAAVKAVDRKVDRVARGLPVSLGGRA